MATQRIGWIDCMRGLCMLAILLFHTEAYYSDVGEIIPYNFYVANVLTAFFFLSGYLFMGNNRPFSLKRKLHAILVGIVIPYFVFTLLLALPRSMMTDHTLNDVLTMIILGKASWFVAALAVAETLFALILAANKRWLVHIVPWMAIIVAALLTGIVDDQHNYWKFHNAFIALFFIYLGHLYRSYEHKSLSRFLHAAIAIGSLLLLVLIKVYTVRTNQSWVIDGVEITCYPMFIIDMVLGIDFLMSLIKFITPSSLHFPLSPFICYVGSHSLIYYFFCGAVPMAVSVLLHRLSFTYDDQYWHILMAFVLVCLVSTAIVAMMNPLYRKLKSL